MQIGKIRPVATIVAQFTAGVDVEAIQHEGKLFLPVTTMGEFATKETAPVVEDETEEEAPKSKKKKAAAVEDDDDTTDETKIYTEDELMDMEPKEIKKILKDLDIDPDDFDGKNTNKKLRKLILDAQAGSSDTEDDDDEEKPKSKKSAKKEADDDDESTGDNTSKVADILDDYDGGKINTKKATAKLAELLSANEKDVAKLLDKFDDDEDGDIDDWAKKITKKLSSSEDDDDEEEDEKPAKKGKAAKKEKEEELVEPEDLKKGDRVSVYWADEDNKCWYDGKVKSIKGSKITIAYDDDTEEVLDPEVNTKIKILDEE